MEIQQEGGLSLTKYIASVGETTLGIKVISDCVLEIQGKVCEFSFEPLGERSFSLIVDGRSYLVELLSNGNKAFEDVSGGDGVPGATTVLSIRGRQYTVLVDDERSLLLKSFITKAHSGVGALVVRAPMPGLISRIEVRVGEEVKKGTGLLVLEAMKMENEIRAVSDGKVKTIHVEQGRPVEKGEPLITIE